MNYVATAHKPSKVTHTAVGWFLGGSERNLLVARVTRIEVHAIGPLGLTRVTDLPIYGRVCAMSMFRPPGAPRDDLIIVTEKHKLAIVRWDHAAEECVTVLTCDVRDTMGSPVFRSFIHVVDPAARCIALHQYQHLLKIVPTSMAKDAQAFNLRLYEEDVQDIVFIHSPKDKPTIAVLSRDSDDAYHLNSYVISLSEQDISEGPLSRHNLDAPATRLAPVPGPCGGVIVLSEQSVSYLNVKGGKSTFLTIPIQPAFIKAIGAVDEDGSRFLLGDHMGKLLMLILELDSRSVAVKSLAMDSLGETSIPSSISYLDNGFVFVGSDYGDSQLIKLNSQRDPQTQHYTEVMHTYPNLGPITDFCVVKGAGHTRQGQGQVVTCSGAMKDGSLRIIRNGIGISEQAAVELPGIKEMWSLRRHYGERYHGYLMQSFASETRVLELIGSDEMAPATLPNIDEDSTTLFAGNLVGDLIVQVTSSGVRVLDCVSLAEASVPAWSPPADSTILVAAGNASQLVLATTGGNLVYLDVDTEKRVIVEQGRISMDNEIACINCNPLGSLAEDGTPLSTSATVAAVGLWAAVNEPPMVRLVALPTLTEIASISLENDVMARDVLLVTLEGHDYFLVALGDGHLLSYKYSGSFSGLGDESDVAMVPASGEGDSVSRSVVSERRRLSVGTQPAALSLFRSRGSNHVFAACDRPTVVYSERGGGKLLVSNVNLEHVTRVCAFDTEAFPDCLAVASNENLLLGAVDEIQKLHIQTVPLGQQARRIVHVESARVFAVLTEATRIDESGEEYLDCFLRLFDDSTFESLDQFKVNPHEVCSSLCVTKLKGEGIDEETDFLVVGCGDVPPNEPESKTGRLIFFIVKNKKLEKVAQIETRGVVYCLSPLDGRVLAGVHSLVLVFSASRGADNELVVKEDLSFHGHVLVLRLQVRGDFVLVGDLMRSVTLLSKRSVGGDGLEQLAQDYDTAWTMALEIVEDDTFLVAEMSKNLMTLRRNSQAPNDNERMRLQRVGVFHVGALVNRIQQGSLVMQMGDDGDSLPTKTMLFGTADGMLGVIASLSSEDYDFFIAVQEAMAAQLPGIGGLDHADWRQFVTETPPRATLATGFVDGDLVELFLELSRTQAAQVAATVGHSVEVLTRRIEAMQRLH